MNFKRKLLLLLISFSIIIPINIQAISKYLIPGGENIGIRVESDGVFVVGFYKVNKHDIAQEAGFKIGDRIISINDNDIHNVNDLINQIDSTSNELNIKYGIMRNDKLNFITMKLSKEKDDTYKTGLYVKDSIVGIGTVTFIEPNTMVYGALGHEVIESNTGMKFTIKSGKIYQSEITSITKSSIGKTGEKNAKLHFNTNLGNVFLNLETGIFGKMNKIINNDEALPVASIDEVEIGNAEIITVLEDNKKEHFKVEILSIDKKNATKNFLLKVTDERLLNKAGGIVKGMSGSPIIQNGKIIGAVTHTIVDNPTKGFGISIIKMLESIE